MATVRRLGPGDEAVARALFEMMATVFEEDEASNEPPDVTSLLRREAFWALAAMEGDVVVGGLTAHALPMTRSRSSELFIYDLAVAVEHQRRGIGRALVAGLRSLAAEAGITTVFVPADDEDTHALDFYRAIGGVPSPVTFFTFSS
ncbi:MAG: GNAT family N-acetyltransferase [Archangiaceae bacterium]|nr:GNAT family N-acetyltransferase [Archangiaceae bacterium]